VDIELEERLRALLGKYPGIQALYKIQKKKSIQELILTRYFTTNVIGTRKEYYGAHARFLINPKRNTNDRVHVILSVVDDGIAEILSCREEFSSEEFRLLDLICADCATLQEMQARN
jgi:hypothetical protein